MLGLPFGGFFWVEDGCNGGRSSGNGRGDESRASGHHNESVQRFRSDGGWLGGRRRHQWRAEVVLDVGPVGVVAARPVAWGSRRFWPAAASSMASAISNIVTVANFADFPPPSPPAPSRQPILAPTVATSTSCSRLWRLLPARARKEGEDVGGRIELLQASSARHL